MGVVQVEKAQMRTLQTSSGRWDTTVGLTMVCVRQCTLGMVQVAY